MLGAILSKKEKYMLVSRKGKSWIPYYPTYTQRTSQAQKPIENYMEPT